MFPELKKDLENSSNTAAANYIDAAARRASGKVFFRNRELHDFACFDVLGLAQNSKVKRAAHEAIEFIGVGNCGSRKNAGTSSAHLICEKQLANFFGYEKSLLFSSKNQVVFSLLATVLREQDQVFCDSDYAGLLADICLLLNCSLEILNLSDLVALESALTPSSSYSTKRRIVFADSVSNSSGRKLDLLALSALCARQQALLIVDESCAAGILGPRGAGLADEMHFGLSPTRPYCLISDLGFGLGCYGACLCGPAILVDALAARSKTLASEPSFPAHLAASINCAVDVIESSITSRALVKTKTSLLYFGLAKIKHRLTVGPSSFVSINFSKWSTGTSLCEYLFSKGFFCEVVPSPSKFSENCFIRIIPSSWHSEELISELLAIIDNFFLKSPKI